MIGKKLKDAMINAGLNQKEFAKLIKTDQSLVSRWILEERKPSAKNLKKISEVLNLPVSFFLARSFSIKKDSDKDLKLRVISLEKKVSDDEKEMKFLRNEILKIKLKLEKNK